MPPQWHAELHRWLKTQHRVLRESEEQRRFVAQELIRLVPSVVHESAFNPDLSKRIRDQHLKVVRMALLHLMEQERATGSFEPVKKVDEQPPGRVGDAPKNLKRPYKRMDN